MKKIGCIESLYAGNFPESEYTYENSIQNIKFAAVKVPPASLF